MLLLHWSELWWQVWGQRSTQCSNVNSGLNINQESTRTAWSCLDLTFLTPVKGKQDLPVSGFFKQWRIWHLPDLWVSVWEGQSVENRDYCRTDSILSSPDLKIFPESKELTGCSTVCVCVRVWKHKNEFPQVGGIRAERQQLINHLPQELRDR